MGSGKMGQGFTGKVSLDREANKCVISFKKSTFHCSLRGVGEPEATEEEITGWTNNQLAKYQRIGGVDFMRDLPRNPAGKVQKKELRAYAKITLHFRIPSSGHLRPRLNRKIL